MDFTALYKPEEEPCYEYRVTKGGKPEGNGWERTPDSKVPNSWRRERPEYKVKNIRPSRPSLPQRTIKPDKPTRFAKKDFSYGTDSKMNDEILVASDYEYIVTDGGRPEGEGWERTPHPRVRNSWRRKTRPNHEKHNIEESRVKGNLYKVEDIPYSVSDSMGELFGEYEDPLRKYLRLFYNDDSIRFDLKDRFSDALKNNPVTEYIEDFGDDGYARNDDTRKKLSALAARMTGVGPDNYCITEDNMPEVTDEEVENARKVSKACQEILKMTGFVNDDGTVTLYRGTNNQFDESTGKYRGANCESWTVNPNKAFRESQILKADIPLERVIGCFAGTGMYEHDENEVTCCTNDLDFKVEKLKPDKAGTYLEALDQEYEKAGKRIYDKIRDTVNQYLNYEKTGMTIKDMQKMLSEMSHQEAFNKIVGTLEATPPILDSLKENPSWVIRLKVAGHPNTNDNTLEFMKNDRNKLVKETAGKNLKSRKNENSEVSEKDEETPEQKQARETLSNMSLKEKKASASSSETSPEMLDILSGDDSEDVRLRVALNNRTSPETLEKLFNDGSENIMIGISLNANTPSNVLEKLAENPQMIVRTNVASNYSTPPKVLDNLSKDKNSTVKRGAIMNPHTPEETIERISEDVNDSLSNLAKDILAKHRMSSRDLKKLADGGDEFSKELLKVHGKIRHDFCLGIVGDESTYSQMKDYKKSIGERKGHGRSPEQVKQDFIKNMNPASYPTLESYWEAEKRIQEMPVEKFDRLLGIIFNKDEEEMA